MSNKNSTRTVVDPFAEMQEYKKRIPGQEEADQRRLQEIANDREYREHLREKRREFAHSLVSTENAMPANKATKLCLISAGSAVVLAAVIFLILFNVRYYLPNTQSQFIENFNQISNVDSYTYLFETYPRTKEFVLQDVTALPDESAPIYINNGNFYLYAETNGEKIISVTAGAVDGYTGFNKEAGAFVDANSEIEYKAFLMRVMSGYDSTFFSDFVECSDVIDRIQSRSGYGNYDYVYKDKYLITYNFSNSLYFNVRPVNLAVASFGNANA